MECHTYHSLNNTEDTQSSVCLDVHSLTICHPKFKLGLFDEIFIVLSKLLQNSAQAKPHVVSSMSSTHNTLTVKQY